MENRPAASPEEVAACSLKRLERAVEGFVTQLQCAICLCAYDKPSSLPCNHCFCEECIHRALELKPVCPICKMPAKKRRLRYDTMLQQLMHATSMLVAPSDSCISDASDQKPADKITEATDVNIKPEPLEQTSTTRSTSAEQPTALDAPPMSRSNSQFTTQLSPAVVEIQHGRMIVPNQLDSTPIRTRRRQSKATATKNSSSIENETSKMERPSVNSNTVAPMKETPPAQVPSSNEQYPLNGPFHVGDLVEVATRTWVGVNKLGGTARITEVNGDGTYNVKYVIGSSRDNNVHDYFITKPSEEIFSDLTASHAVKQRQRRRSKSAAEETTPPSANGTIKANSSRSSSGGEAANNRRKQSGMVFLCSGFKDEIMREIEVGAELLGADIVGHWSDRVTHLIVYCVRSNVAEALNGFKPSFPTSTERSTTSGKRKLFGDAAPVKRWVKIRSMKYLKALIGGRWIVSEEWLQACIAHGGYVSEVDFEADGHMKGKMIDNAVRKSRKMREAHLSQCPDLVDPSTIGTQLFDKFCFHLVGEFLPPMPPQMELNTLLRIGGGKLIPSLDDIAGEMAKQENQTRRLVIVCDKINPHTMKETTKYLKTRQQLKGITNMAIVNYQWVVNSISEAQLRPL